MNSNTKKINLINLRLSFPPVFQKSVFEGKEGKFEATFILNKTDHKKIIKELVQEAKELEKKGISEKTKAKLKGGKLSEDKICLKDGDEQERENYQNCFYFKASSNKRPLCVNKDRSPLTQEDGKIYGGCYVNAIITLWCQDNNYGARINANLLALQFFKDGDTFGDMINVDAQEFELYDEEDDENQEDVDEDIAFACK